MAKAKYIEECKPYTVRQITPTVYFYEKVNDWSSILPTSTKEYHIRSYKDGQKADYQLLDLHMGFDTEFYTNQTRNAQGHIISAKAYMYVWQMSINDIVIIGRKWEQFYELMNKLESHYNLGYDKKIRIWVANLGCEFQFIRKQLNVTDIFAREKRGPIYVEINNSIIMQDCLALSGGSLNQLAKDFTATKKLKGDLDYTKPRNSRTPLTDKELGYIINDVVILAEWDIYLINTYLEQGHQIPLTKTAILRKSVQKRFRDYFKCTVNGKKYTNKSAVSMYTNCIPNTPEEYNIITRHVYRGGYTHANVLHAGVTLSNVNGVDFTSSYPAVIMQCLYPMTPFIPQPHITTEDYLNKLTDAWYGKIRFYNLRPKTCHSIESASKTEEYTTLKGNLKHLREMYNMIIDNGRVVSADEMTVWLTDLDWAVYKNFYEWDSCKIKHVRTSHYGKLPEYLTDPIKYYYTKKCVIKAQLKKLNLDTTPEYALAKSMVNAGYGLTVQRLVTDEITYTNNTWNTEIGCKSYYELIGARQTQFGSLIVDNGKSALPKLALLPQWGVWVCAHARKRLLDMVYNIGEDVIYCDTDSIYMLNPEKHKKIIESWNDMIHSWNKLNLPAEFETLGDFDWLSKTNYDRFKTLGAKRYIKSHGNDVEVTIAGLPKGTLQNYCDTHNKEIYDFFNDGMMLEFPYTCKNAHAYNDEPHSDYITDEFGNTEYMQETSSLGIYEASFTMCLDDVYASLIEETIKITNREEVV